MVLVVVSSLVVVPQAAMNVAPKNPSAQIATNLGDFLMGCKTSTEANSRGCATSVSVKMVGSYEQLMRIRKN